MILEPFCIAIMCAFNLFWSWAAEIAVRPFCGLLEWTICLPDGPLAALAIFCFVATLWSAWLVYRDLGVDDEEPEEEWSAEKHCHYCLMHKSFREFQQEKRKE